MTKKYKRAEVFVLGNDSRNSNGQGRSERSFSQYDIDLDGKSANRVPNQSQQQSQRAQRPQRDMQNNGQSSSAIRQPQVQGNRSSTSAAKGQKSQAYANNPNAVNQVRRPLSPNGASGANRSRKKKKKKKTGLIITVILLLVLVTGVGATIGVFTNRISGANTQGTLPEELRTPTWEGADVISGLICGLDYDNDSANGYTSADKVGHTDMILYVRYDTKNNKAVLMQIPRDMYVGTASDLKDSKGNALVSNAFRGKINEVYYTALDTDNRMAALATVINQEFSLPVDFYVTIDMDALKEIVDIKGWIEVYVPMDIVDPDHPTTRLNQGWQNLTGDQVEFLLRNRYNPGYNQKMDIARLQTQQSFYSALFREFKTLQPKDLMMWMNVLTYRCKTDMGIMQLGGLAQKALGIQGSDITFIRPACGVATTENGVSVVSLVKDDTANLLNQYLRNPENPVPASELGIKELPMYVGVNEADIKTMADVQAKEPEPAAA